MSGRSSAASPSRTTRAEAVPSSIRMPRGSSSVTRPPTRTCSPTRIGQVGKVDVTSRWERVARGGGRRRSGGTRVAARPTPGCSSDAGGRGGSRDANVGRVAREDRETLVRGGRVWPPDDAGHRGDAILRQRVDRDPGAGLADDDDLPPAEPDLGPPAVTELVHAGHRAVDPDELATREPLPGSDRRTTGAGTAPLPRRVTFVAWRRGAPYARFTVPSTWSRVAMGGADTPVGRRTSMAALWSWTHDPPTGGVEQGRRRRDHAIDGHACPHPCEGRRRS